MRSRRPAEAFTVKSSGGSQQRSTWQSAEIISYRIARERSSAELARQAPWDVAQDQVAEGTAPTTAARAAAGARRGARKLVVVPSAELAPDLAARGEVRVDVRVGDAGTKCPDHLVELTGRELLTCGGAGHDIGSGDSSDNGAGLRAGGRPGRAWQRRRPAEPDDDAAVHATLGDVDMGLLHGPLETAVCEFVLDALIVWGDRRLELAACDGGDRGDLLEPDQPRMHLVAAMVVIVGHGRHRQQGQEEEKGEQAGRAGGGHRGLLSRWRRGGR